MLRSIGILCLLCTFALKAQFNYGHQMEFGKNRVQFKPFFWQYIDHGPLKIYYYQGGFDLAKFASVSAHKEFALMQKRLDYTPTDPLSILVFNTQSDFQQSNVGYSVSDQSNIGGTTRFVGDKIFVFSNGKLSDLERQIRYALAQWMIQKILFSGTTGETYRNGTFMDIPAWFTEGLALYLSEGFSESADLTLYDVIKSQKFSKFSMLPAQQSARISQFLWFYVSAFWGERMIGNILYLTKLTRKIDPAFMGSLGLTLPDITREMQEYYQLKLFKHRDSTVCKTEPLISVLKRHKQDRTYYQFKWHPNGYQAAYVRNDRNQYRVYKFDSIQKKSKRIFKLGCKIDRLPMLQYPLIEWHPDGEHLILIYPKKGQLQIGNYSLKDNSLRERPLSGFQHITGIGFHPSGKFAVVSGVTSQSFHSDLFKYTLSSGGIEPLTNDVWDDFQPSFSPDGKSLYYTSNRVLNPQGRSESYQPFNRMPSQLNVFYSTWPRISETSVPVTQGSDALESEPLAFDRGVYFLSNKNGNANLYVAYKDSALAFVDTIAHFRTEFHVQPKTHLDRSLVHWSMHPSGSLLTLQTVFKGQDRWVLSTLPPDSTYTNLPLNWRSLDKLVTAVKPEQFAHVIPVSTDTQKPKHLLSDTIDTENYIFYSDTLLKPTLNKELIIPKNQQLNDLRFPLSQNYYTTFYTDYLVNQFDNSFLANNYQVFSGSGSPIYLNPGFNILSKISISDLMENQRIIGGYRINPSLDNEFMLSWEFRQNRWDHQCLLDRQTFNNTTAYTQENAPYQAKMITHTIRYSLKYPFTEVMSLRWSLLYRNDLQWARSYGPVTAALANRHENMIGSRLEWVFDDTRSVDLNILNGLRFKVFSEYWQYTNFRFTQPQPKGNLITSGFDIRYYLKIHRQMTWCNRLAGGNALGSERLIFYLGGVDNWYNPQFNTNVNIIKPEQYGFQTIATNMRGFSQNTRNGNNFLVLNSEWRLPIVHYLFNRDFNSDFINYFQVIGFTDLGMAWYNWNPLSDENTKNTNTYIDQDPALGYGGSGMIIRIINYNNPLVGGLGFGLRTRFLGYFMRLDFGWGIDNWKLQKRMVGLSLTTDF